MGVESINCRKGSYIFFRKKQKNIYGAVSQAPGVWSLPPMSQNLPNFRRRIRVTTCDGAMTHATPQTQDAINSIDKDSMDKGMAKPWMVWQTHLGSPSKISLDLRTLQGMTTLGRVQLLDAFAVYIGMQRSAILV